MCVSFSGKCRGQVRLIDAPIKLVEHLIATPQLFWLTRSHYDSVSAGVTGTDVYEFLLDLPDVPYALPLDAKNRMLRLIAGLEDFRFEI
jgi:hypothetical protein